MRIIVHGGCGTRLTREEVASDRETRCRKAMRSACEAGLELLRGGGSAVDAAVAATLVLEDHPDFNAGKGSVLNVDGVIECDAGIMCGQTGRAGGVAGTRRIRNPINAALLVMQTTPASLLCGQGADDFAEIHRLSLVENDYFLTEMRQQQLLEQKAAANGVGHLMSILSQKQATIKPTVDHDGTVGTVGAVVLDNQGRLAASSSTGGLSGKLPGRVSDSCIAGSGLWADHRFAVSATGDGDVFIAKAAVKDAVDRAHLLNISIDTACRQTVDYLSQPYPNIGVDQFIPSAGLIALDVEGNISFPFNTPGMFYAYSNEDGTDVIVKIFKDE